MADAGRQWLEPSSKPIWSASTGLASARDAALRWRVALQASNAAPLAGDVAAYCYTSLVVHIAVPF